MKKVFLSIILLFVMSACSVNNNEQDSSSAEEENKAAEVPEVQVEFEHQPLPLNEETTIQASVTQGGEPVPDAEYVEFEIWNSEDGQDSSETFEAKHTENGVYTITHSFAKEGTYQVIAHTQVDDLHTMPETEVAVGQQAEASGHEHGDDRGKFMVHLMTEQSFKAGESSTLTTHINHMEEPFSEAKVRYEISSDQMEKHVYIGAEESERGEYTTTYTFPSPGTYTINVHYEKPDEDIHGHQKETIEVIQ
ncbi:FixH family protein [Halobacillus sp. Nhm2S1]|uniref:FixH family protein n=1 Tax=Halobacillus sp. Nhm2S1 TaxID=2866716 RepID=UPI001C739F0A|nr:FixH family protein [Halobacillus sp. Nhm2S1]MBX0359195.1 FixH family protein [Halobacillus sp. Nhm2S1]